MKTITLIIEDNIFEEFIALINNKFQSHISIVDDDFFSDDDELAYLEAIKQLENGEALSLDQLKAELNV